MEKKFTIRYNALVTGLRLVIIIIAEPKARMANKRVIMFSAFHFIVVIRKVLKQVPGAGIEPALRYYPNRILSPARLPVPPSGQYFKEFQAILVHFWLNFCGYRLHK